MFRRQNSSSVAFFIFALGCSETGISELDKTQPANGARIEVDPLSLNFGVFSTGSDPIPREFTMTNVGTGELDIDQLEIVGADAVSFSIWQDPGPLTLLEGETETVTVLFQAGGASSLAAQIMVRSNDPDEPTVPVNLVGEGAVPDLVVIPDPLDMGSTYVGCNKLNEVLLSNNGLEALTIYSYAYSDPSVPFVITSGPALPITLEPGEFTSISVQFEPTDNSVSIGDLQIVSNDPDDAGLYNATQLGTGEYIATYEQYWENPVDPPSDIIFAVDQSCSMDDDAANLASNFSSFINELSNYSNDWQIMVVNDDNGCTNSGILTPNTPSFQSTFSYAVQSGGGSYTEALLTVTANAVENTDSGECNYGFMRSNAMLHVVMVSDEPEQSWSQWNTFVDQMIAKKGNADNVRLSAIAGDYPSGCWASGNSADPGTGYWEAVNATNGVFLSICSNWASPSNLQVLAEASVISDAYPLDHEAIPDTIMVYHNGTPVEGTWNYDTSLQSVVFIDGMAPEEGDTIRIVYSSPATCD